MSNRMRPMGGSRDQMITRPTKGSLRFLVLVEPLIYHATWQRALLGRLLLRSLPQIWLPCQQSFQFFTRSNSTRGLGPRSRVLVFKACALWGRGVIKNIKHLRSVPNGNVLSAKCWHAHVSLCAAPSHAHNNPMLPSYTAVSQILLWFPGTIGHPVSPHRDPGDFNLCTPLPTC